MTPGPPSSRHPELASDLFTALATLTGRSNAASAEPWGSSIADGSISRCETEGVALEWTVFVPVSLFSIVGDRVSVKLRDAVPASDAEFVITSFTVSDAVGVAVGGNGTVIDMLSDGAAVCVCWLDPDIEWDKSRVGDAVAVIGDAVRDWDNVTVFVCEFKNDSDRDRTCVNVGVEDKVAVGGWVTMRYHRMVVPPLLSPLFGSLFQMDTDVPRGSLRFVV